MTAAQTRVLRHLAFAVVAVVLTFLAGWLKNDSTGLLEPSMAGLLAMAASELAAFITANE